MRKQVTKFNLLPIIIIKMEDVPTYSITFVVGVAVDCFVLIFVVVLCLRLVVGYLSFLQHLQVLMERLLSFSGCLWTILGF